MDELALFAGAGGGILGGKLLGWRTICAVERNEYAASVLAQRQNDGHLEPFPIWSNVCTFDGKPWRGRVDVVSGGFPCQDISSAGKGAGIEGERSGLWMEMARIVNEVRPRFVFVENSPVLTSRGLGRVLGDLASMGYDAEWGVVGAHHAGAPHKRDRIWIVAAHANCERRREKQVTITRGQDPTELGDDGAKKPLADTKGFYVQGFNKKQRERQSGGGSLWKTEPQLGRVAHGVANRVDRLKAIGNGQVPAVAALAWEILTQRITDENHQ